MADQDYTLTIGGDNQDLVATLKDTIKNLHNLGSNVERSLQRPQHAFNAVSSQLKSLGTVAKTAIAGMVGGMGIKSLTHDFMEYHANLANAVQVMGYNVSEVEALGGAMRRFGGDTTGAISSLDNLSDALQQARWGTGSLVSVAQQYGITYMKSNGQLMSSEELLKSLSSQLNTFDNATKKAIASQLGLDSALLRVIDSGQFDTMIASQKQLNLTTQDDLKIATDLESAWLDVKDMMSSFAKEISRAVLPPLTKFLRFLGDLMKSIKEFQHKGVLAWGALGVAIVPIVGKIMGIVTAMKSITTMTSAVNTVKTVFQSLGIAIKSAFMPVGLAIVAFTVVYALVEDLYMYFTGGKSMFGDLAKEYPAVQAFLDGLGSVIDIIKSGVSTFLDFLKEPSWEKFGEMLKGIANTVTDAFLALGQVIWDVLKRPITWVQDQLKKLLPNWALKMIGASPEQETTTATSTAPAVSTATLAKAGNTSNSQDNRQVVNNVNIHQTVEGGNATSVLQATQKGVGDSLDKINTQYVK